MSISTKHKLLLDEMDELAQISGKLARMEVLGDTKNQEYSRLRRKYTILSSSIDRQLER